MSSLEQPEHPPSSGLVAGKYRLEKLIGRGGMGSVWEACHASLGTRFAIKFIEAEYADSQEARSRFDKEARAAATIQSKHAIQIYDHGVTHDGKPYIVMELLQGEPLDKRIERAGRLTLQDTARILQQVSRGLARAHERGIVHRDLKPENIFLVRTPDDDEEVAKVLDFGIAKDLNNKNPAVSSSTKTGAVLGTPFYMSPEQARGLKNVDHRTDLWSLGVIAFKCVTGSLPFDGESVGDLLVKICTAPMPVPSHVVPGLPPSFDAWFMRALERDPDRRFSTAQELSEALAFAAGTGRGIPSSNAHPPPMSGLSTVAAGQSNTGPTPTPQNYGTPPPAGGMTNAPFTASARRTGGSSSGTKLLFGVLAALGLLVGVIAIVAWKMTGSGGGGSASAGTGLKPTTGASTAAVAPLVPNETTTPVEPLASALAVPPTPAAKPPIKPGPLTISPPVTPAVTPPVTPPASASGKPSAKPADPKPALPTPPTPVAPTPRPGVKPPDPGY